MLYRWLKAFKLWLPLIESIGIIVDGKIPGELSSWVMPVF